MRERGHHRVEVQQRLALAHQDDVCLRLERCAILFERNQHLTDDFAGGEVANQAKRSRQAEMAIDGTAGLSRNADRLAILFGHEHGFDRRRLQRTGALL